MNRSDIKKLCEFPHELDELVNSKFPSAKCKTTFDIISMRHTTTWNDKLPQVVKERIKIFVEGFMAGHDCLRSKLSK